MPTLPNHLRDQAVTAFRQRLCDALDFVPFPHQAAWWLAADGLILGDRLDPDGYLVQNPDGIRERRQVFHRPGGRAKVIADLGAFKVGKSKGAGLFAASFGCIPDGRVSLVGLEYDICAPEFDYICDALLSESGLGMQAKSLQNRPRDGRMWLDLPNGCRFEAKSWERKDSLKGKEIDCYIFCEAYQLPGIEVFTANSQNLRARQGYSIFPTTPDRPWVQIFHELGHGTQPDWHCTCGVSADVNPYTFDAKAKARDAGLMTREKFAIHYEGKLGDFVGRVFNFQRGMRQFTTQTHPHLWHDTEQPATLANFRVPQDWELVNGADTGTFYTAASVLFSPQGQAFVVGEWPNYRYVAGQAERDEDVTIPQWATAVTIGVDRLGGRPNFWADKNTQFKKELRNHGMTLLGSDKPLEARTEIAREYFQHEVIWLAPWLSVLPFEIENACWPDEASAAGKFARKKDRDHTLDCLEHVLSRRPRARVAPAKKTGTTWVEQFTGRLFPSKKSGGNPHLGAG